MRLDLFVDMLLEVEDRENNSQRKENENDGLRESKVNETESKSISGRSSKSNTKLHSEIEREGKEI